MRDATTHEAGVVAPRTESSVRLSKPLTRALASRARVTRWSFCSLNRGMLLTSCPEEHDHSGEWQNPGRTISGVQNVGLHHKLSSLAKNAESKESGYHQIAPDTTVVRVPKAQNCSSLPRKWAD